MAYEGLLVVWLLALVSSCLVAESPWSLPPSFGGWGANSRADLCPNHPLSQGWTRGTILRHHSCLGFVSVIKCYDKWCKEEIVLNHGVKYSPSCWGNADSRSLLEAAGHITAIVRREGECVPLWSAPFPSLLHHPEFAVQGIVSLTIKTNQWT